MQALVMTVILAASVLLNVAMAIPFVVWFRALMRVGRSPRLTCEAFEHLFGHLSALRGQAVLFFPDGKVELVQFGRRDLEQLDAIRRARRHDVEPPAAVPPPPTSQRTLGLASAFGWLQATEAP